MLVLIENNKNFCLQLQERYSKNYNVIIVNDSAENADVYLKNCNIEKADYVVSGLSFASLPQLVSNRILEKTGMILKEDGLFITFQYTLLKKNYIAGYFQNIKLEEVMLNLPPAYIFKCKGYK